MRCCRVFALGPLIVATALACEWPAGPWTVSLGLIDPGGGFGAMSLVVPESAIVGVPASVQASTWGSSCTQPDRTVTQVIGLLADITLYDRDPPAGTPCARILKGIARNVTVTFSLPGEATVRLHGRSFTDTTTIGASLTVR